MQTIDDFDNQDWDSFHDVLCEATGQHAREFDRLSLRAIFLRMPEEVRDTAYTWGLADTEARDEAFAFVKKNPAIVDTVVETEPLPRWKRECPNCGALQVVRIVQVTKWDCGDPRETTPVPLSASVPVYRCEDCREEWTDWQTEVIQSAVQRHCMALMEYPEGFDRNRAPMTEPGRYVIHDPKELMTPEQRAFEMWAVHPADLQEMGMTREEFFAAHIKAAARYG
jgi:hypothetical protein